MKNKIFFLLCCIGLSVQLAIFLTTTSETVMGMIIGKEIGACIFGILFYTMTKEAIEGEPEQKHSNLAFININAFVTCIVYGLSGIIYITYRTIKKKKNVIDKERTTASFIIAALLIFQNILLLLDIALFEPYTIPIATTIVAIIDAIDGEAKRVNALKHTDKQIIEHQKAELQKLYKENDLLKQNNKELQELLHQQQ